MSVPSGGKSETCTVELRHGDLWIKLTLYLGEEFSGGSVVRLTPEADYRMEGANELSSSYGKRNWLSGAASGAFYAYRSLRLPGRVAYVTDFTGRLRSADMAVVAEAAARAVAGCLHRDPPPTDLVGWELQNGIATANQEVAVSLASPPAAAPAIAQ